MRIHSDMHIPQAADSGAAARPAARTVAADNSGALASDSSKLSSAQANVPALAATVNQLPEIRREKVAALAQLVRNGTYSPRPEQAAEALMSYMQTSPGS